MNRPATTGHFPVFMPGDRIPDFNLPDVLGNAFGLTLSSVGKPLLLFVAGAEPAEHLAALAAAADDFREATVLCISRLDPAGNRALAERVRLPFALLSDRAGQVSTALLNGGTPGAAPTLAVYTLDANQRVRQVTRGSAAAAQIDAAREALAGLLPPPDATPMPRPAPLLLIPGVFEPAFCRELIEVWQTQGNEPTGTIDVRARDQDYYDKTVKVRRDHYIRDETLKRRVAEAISRRIAPEIDKAFCFQATRAEEFKIACYDAESGGHFRPHRDNLSERTRHRRFAMSLLLNDPEEYQGGALRFLEYGPETYKPHAGEAAIFSCSLLHEVLPITAGRRYVLLCFLFGEAEVQALQARARRPRP